MAIKVHIIHDIISRYKMTVIYLPELTCTIEADKKKENNYP